jgi:coenzyme F420-reducing hydrogenase alpha subunit
MDNTTIKSPTFNVNLHHITRLEGHGNIVVDVDHGILQQCELEIVEAPRFFEAMLRGRYYHQAPKLASRICGICAVAHATTAIRAVEKALGVEPSEQTVLLRKLNYYGEMLDSHLLHIYMLVAPDLLGTESVVSLAKSAPGIVLRALRMKQLAGDICKTISGRHTHPIAMTVGGFTHYPSVDEVYTLRERLHALRSDIEDTVADFHGLKLPNFDRDTEYIALTKEDEYCFIDGAISSTDGGVWPVEQYRQVTNEYLTTHSSAKHTHHQRNSYMVGALARFNLSHRQLHPKAKSAAVALELSPKCTNPYKITTAQIVELVHCYENAILIMDQLLAKKIVVEEPAEPASLSGEGVGACEAPRGTLYHHFVIQAGYLSEANCIIPTGQNLANIEADMRSLVPHVMHQTAPEITQTLEMLVRAYDPCISCSTHLLQVDFV